MYRAYTLVSDMMYHIMHIYVYIFHALHIDIFSPKTMLSLEGSYFA